jgi:hypothetical protein
VPSASFEELAQRVPKEPEQNHQPIAPVKDSDPKQQESSSNCFSLELRGRK